MRTRSLAALFATSMLLLACGSSTPDISTAKSDKQRVLSPQVSDQDLAAQVKADNTFALELFQKVRGAGNAFISPHSISTALAMLYGGARTATEQQMAATLHFPLPQGQLHAILDKLDLELSSRGKGASGTDGQPFQLTVANALWGRPDGHYLPDYLDLLALNYGAGMNLVDFGHDPEAARNQINAWVAARTRDRIKELLQSGEVDTYTALVLTNAIYLNAAWAEPFQEQATQPAPFDADGSQVSVQMMAGTKMDARYGGGQGFEAVEIPFDGKEVSMLVLLPEGGSFAAFAAGLSWSTVEAALASLTPTPVDLRMPRFEFSSRRQLGEPLQQLGMVDAFNDALADFSGISGAAPGTPGALVVDKVIHQAYVQVAEKGAEAAGATAVVMRDAGMAGPGPSPVPVTLDRSFLFFIRDQATGAVLFTGQLVDPNAPAM